MRLRTKFNLVLLAIFLLGLAISAAVTRPFLQDNAHREVLERARIMMASAAGARKYTSEHIAPLLLPMMGKKFHPQAVSAFAALKTFEVLQADFPDYAYREAAINPTNPKNRAIAWEADIIQAFRARPGMSELISYRETPLGRYINLSRPLQVKKNCLACHDTWQDAPPTMVADYGNQNGFGWKDGEIIGAQVVSVPMYVPLRQANSVLLLIMALLAGVFLVLMVLLNLLLYNLVIRPVTEMSRVAREVSMGRLNAPEYVKEGTDEIASLSNSFNRMRRSIYQAIQMLGRQQPPSPPM